MSVTTRLHKKSKPAQAAQDQESVILIDAHVHIYDCFDINTFLTSAWENFQAQANKQGKSTQFTGILLLTETAQYRWFKNLLDQIKQRSDKTLQQDQWTFSLTSEHCSIKASGPKDQQLILIAGRQVITSEKLEVLALITDTTIVDGLSAKDTIQAIHADGGIVSLPWAVGKWLGKRGKLIENLLSTDLRSPFFLGDNSGRPVFWLKPGYFKTIEQQGRQVLPGTDPLPLASEATRPGSFGLAIIGTLNTQTPGKQLKALLLNPQTTWQSYGALESPWGFVRNQLSLRASKKSHAR